MRWIKMDYDDYHKYDKEIEDQLCADYRWNGINEACDMLELKKIRIETSISQTFFHYQKRT